MDWLLIVIVFTPSPSNKTNHVKAKQDQVNNANSEFIFMINLFIIQGCQSGSVGRGDQLVRLVRLIWWSR